MLNTILGTKKEMSQTFVEDTRVPVTMVKAGPCVVTQVKKQDSDGYWAVQIGFGEKKIKNTTKPLLGHISKAWPSGLKGAKKKDKKAPRFLREVKMDAEPDLKVGDEIKVTDVIRPGDTVSVTGTSKGKGFAGVVKRYRFAGGPRTHGQSDRERAPGSIGQGTTPGRVHKGKKMPGRMGGDTVTTKNLTVVSVDADKNEIAISGAVPGSSGGLLTINKIASGKLKDLVKDVAQAQVVEGKPEDEEGEGDEKEDIATVSEVAREEEKDES